MKVTMKDIARKAGVTPSTVSRVLSGSTRISEETARRVHAIMQEMDYQPNQLARSLVSQKSNIVAAILPQVADKALADPFNYEVLGGICGAAQCAGYHVLLSTGSDAKHATDDTDSARALVQGGIVGGIILLTSRVEDQIADMLHQKHFPFVVLGHPKLDTKVNWVDNDNVAASRMATQYLITRGHRRIAYAGCGPEYRVSADRMAGFRQAHTQNGLEVDARNMLKTAYSDTGLDAESVRKLFSRPDRPSAILALSDTLALSLLEQFKAIGLRVPQDVSLISFNNVQAALSSQPPLTTIDLEPKTLGRRVFELLLQAIEDPRAGTNRALVPYHLIERESVADIRAGTQSKAL